MPGKEFRLPAEVLADLTTESADLLDSGQEFVRAKRSLAEQEGEWALDRAKVLIELAADPSRKEAADVREARVLDRLCAERPGRYADLLKEKARVEGLDKRVRIHQARIDALRSELAYLKTEWEHSN